MRIFVVEIFIPSEQNSELKMLKLPFSLLMRFEGFFCSGCPVKSGKKLHRLKADRDRCSQVRGVRRNWIDHQSSGKNIWFVRVWRLLLLSSGLLGSGFVLGGSLVSGGLSLGSTSLGGLLGGGGSSVVRHYYLMCV